MLKKSILYVGVVYIIQILNIIISLLLIRNFSLEQLGQITIAKVYFQFMDYTHLGSRFAMDRYVPTEDGSSGKYIAIITSMISSIVSIIAILIVHFFINNNIVILAFMISGAIFAQGTIYKAFYRAKENVNNMILVILIITLLPLIVQIVAINFFDFNIYVSSFTISYIVGFIFLNYKFKLIKYIEFSIIKQKIKLLFSASSLLFLSSFIVFLSFSIDKLLLEKYKGTEMLGEYSIILFVFATLMIIPGSLAELIFPKIIQKVKSTGKVFYFKETAFVFFPTLLAVIIANLLMNFFIEKFTDYSYLLSYLHLISWAVLPHAIISIFYHTLNALDRRKNIVIINFIALIIYIVFLYISLFMTIDILQSLILSKMLFGICLIILYVLFLYNRQIYNLVRR